MDFEPKHRRSVVEDYIYPILLSLVGVSLGINSYLIKDKVSEIYDDLKSMRTRIEDMNVQTAILKEHIEAHDARISNLEKLDRFDRFKGKGKG